MVTCLLLSRENPLGILAGFASGTAAGILSRIYSGFFLILHLSGVRGWPRNSGCDFSRNIFWDYYKNFCRCFCELNQGFLQEYRVFILEILSYGYLRISSCDTSRSLLDISTGNPAVIHLEKLAGISTETHLGLYSDISVGISPIVLPRITPGFYPENHLEIVLWILSEILPRIPSKIPASISPEILAVIPPRLSAEVLPSSCFMPDIPPVIHLDVFVGISSGASVEFFLTSWYFSEVSTRTPLGVYPEISVGKSPTISRDFLRIQISPGILPEIYPEISIGIPLWI